jgi:hypothetical protein
MNQAHLHLMTNHVPILGTLCALLVLGFSFFTRAQAVRTAAYLLFVFSAFGAVIANWTGEGAEKIVEDLPGISHPVLEEHEEAADFALAASLTAGVLAVAGMAVSVFRPAWNGRMALAIGILGVLAFSIASRTAYLGGKIRHTELEPPPTQH